MPARPPKFALDSSKKVDQEEKKKKKMTEMESVSACAGFKTLYPRIRELARLIQEFEGYDKGSLSFRNNNPGNLRSSPFAQGKKDGYAKFRSYFDGLFGLMWDLWSKTEGRTRTDLRPTSTFLELIQVYAPPGDSNDPDGYANFIIQNWLLPEPPALDTLLEWFQES